jgi:autotransporter-associated beta strand protein
MKRTLQRFKIRAVGTASIATLFVSGMLPSQAQDVWTGNGSDANWQTPGNWQIGNPPLVGDSLVFTGVNGLNNTNNFLAGTAFGGLSFQASAGAFVINGKSITLNGNITNGQVVTEQSINLPMTLGTTSLIDIVPNGFLTINGVLSGIGGLTMAGGGQLNLTAANTFTGPFTINAGTVSVGKDSSLGAAPSSATPGMIVINGGTLFANNGFTLNANRGITVGSASGGSGIIKVESDETLNYGGVIGGDGGLTKNGFGTLSLSGANVYSGATSNRVGTLTLDFTQAGSPTANIIPSGSDLTLGGENAGFGSENIAQLTMVGKDGAVNSQTFKSTHLTFAGSVVEATSGSGGTANLNLGVLSHDPGGTLLFLPPQVSSGTGSITTTSANLNGILGGWALMGDGTTYSSGGSSVNYATDFAAVAAGGSITNFTDYLIYSSGNLAGQATAGDNVLFAPAGPAVVTVDNANAGTTTDINAIKISAPDSGSTANYYGVYIGQDNTLRLGRYGGILKTDRSRDDLTIGGVDGTVQSGNGETGAQNVGTLTAGGEDNTPGEIVMMANADDESHGSTIFEAKIADNGTGKVTFVKMGSGSIKLDGHNTFSGGLYLLQGRVQFAGSELGSSSTTGNPDGGGTGPIYILPGAYLFPGSFPSGSSITNEIFVAGTGTAAEPLGAIRSGVFSSTINLIGDTTLGGGTFQGPIIGPFNLGLCMPATTHGDVHLASSDNDWTGDTIMNAEDHSGTQTEHVYNETSEVIPNGFGRGNVIMQPGGGRSTSYITWDLNGFNETINGLSTTGNHVEDCIITTSAASGQNSVLTVGDNDQSGTFAGLIQDGGSAAGTLGLTKIGAGVETLAGLNTYSGNTTVSGGTLALSGGSTISSSLHALVQNGAILDVTGQTNNFNYPNDLSLNTDGTFLVDKPATVGTLNMTGGRIRLTTINANVTAGSLNVGGATNLIDITSVGLITGYPAQFTAIKYSGTLSGTFNFGLGNVPSASTTGYISNNVANGSIDVVLLTGPQSLIWTGANGSEWDVATTVNWLAFGTTPSIYNQVDSVTFDDSGSTGTVDLNGTLTPGLVEVNNSALNYTFTGEGSISGFGGMTKDGSGTLVLDNTGVNSFSGGLLISAGTVQVGNNDAAGNLPVVGGVENDGAIVFDRNDNATVASAITGSGSLTQSNASVLTLSGNNTFTGTVDVPQGTLKAGNDAALGAGDGTTTIESGATLDVNHHTLNTEPVIVSGAGVNGAGAIVNSGDDITTALGDVTLAGNTVFGGTGRWDIRGGAAQLLTSGNPYNITKIGTNQVSIVGVNVDSSLGDITVQSGTFSVETSTSGLGNPANTLSIASGTTLQLYNTTASFNKQFALNGDGVTITLNCGNGTGNSISGPVTLSGACIFNAASGSALTFSGSLSGSGSVVKTGSGTNVIASGVSASYSGGTTVSNGVLIVNGSLSGAVTVASGASLAGAGTVSGAVTMQSGNLMPGDVIAGSQGTLTVNRLALNNSIATFHLSSSPDSGNDLVASSGDLMFAGVNTLQITPLAFMNVGDVYTLFTYNGAPLPSSITNSLQIAAPAGFAFSIVDPATTPGAIRIHVDAAIGNITWTGQSSSAWDTSAVNWNRSGNSVAFNNGDFVNFDDSSAVTDVNLTGALRIGNITMNNGSETYHFGGSGSLTGSGGLLLNSGGGLVIANTGSNDFTGPITINSGTLQLGDGGAGGNLGSGVLTNNGSLVLNRSDASLIVNNAISGFGGITKIGSGEATVSGVNTFGGDVIVTEGTLGVGGSSALGNTFGVTTVSEGASLDVANTANVSQEFITVGGSGVGNKGAIVNNSGSPTFVGPNIGQVTLTSDTVIGGSGRLDFRASAADVSDVALFTGSQPFTLTKAGTNQLQMAGVQIDPSLGDVNVEGGLFGIQWNMPLGIGDASHTLTVFGGASFAFFDVSNTISKVLVLNDGASVLGQHGTGNVFAGPVTLHGTNTFNVSNGTLTFANQIGGNGNLVKTGGSTLILSTGPETYTGNTYVNQGVLSLTDVAALTNSPRIVLGGGTIDVTGRADGALTLGAAINQTLAGGGMINGMLMENSGSTINPGNGITTATLNVNSSNGVAAALSGAVVMNLNRTNQLKNDELVVPSSATITGGAGSVLTVANLGPDLQTGDRFQLFSTNVVGFTSYNLPTTSASGAITYTWQNDIATDGSITVLSGAGNVNTTPTNITVTVSNGNLNLSWPADHIGWRLQVQTNALSVGLGTNWMDVPGSTEVNHINVPIDTTKGTIFYRMIH